MRIVMLGVNHQIQGRKVCSASTDGSAERFETDQKERFTQLVRDLIQEHGIGFVAEEARWGDESLAERLCNEQNCQYANIEMTGEERAKRKIEPGYNENPEVSPEEKARGNKEREDYMAEQILTTAEGIENVLVVCGRMHSDQLADRLRSSGHAVEFDDLLKQGWYVEDWQYHMMHKL